MIKLKVWHWLVLIVFLPLVLGSKCWITKKEVINPPPQGCGVGTGDYKFYLVNSVPNNFDCNDSGRFVITLRPKIDPSYSGTNVFNRLYFVLDNGNIYISNYVEFLSGNTADQQLEWGGSVPTGDYEVRGRMKNIQLNSTCPESVMEDIRQKLGTIHITEFSNPSKVMQIEYDCQLADTLFYRFDIFDICSWLDEYMDIAFNIANTRDSVITYWTDLTPQLIEYDPYDPSEIVDYIFGLKQWREKMFLCGIKGFKDYQGNYIVNLLGLTRMDTVTFMPTCSTGSLVAVKACIDIVADKYKIDYNDFVTATTIHELGWQRAIKPSHTHASKFCIMNVGLVVDTSEVAFNRYSNPHFCNGFIS